ncbi:hypothetical protein AGMMS49960_08530 [Betaproteobacteria bacterium]|nr:hypothetical protein AGMMS49543_08470 [Betaproteobacteria bacterium]GHU00463.1 hypothetical protein AGMMS49960_08530 [Betaproteobacteria bacterium]GHU18268.1 hypothetical protein AGMMS50243_08000 [Betaproteobacteria bacterium]
MSISGIQATSTYDLLMSLAGSTKSRPATPASTDSTAYSARNSRSSDKVSISKDAWAMLLAEYEKNKPADVPATESSEEAEESRKAEAAPDWISGYFFTAPPLGSRGDWFEQQYPQAAAAPASMLSEYGKRIMEYWQAIVKENGLLELSVDERYNALRVDKESIEALRQQMAERVRSDPVLVDIMQKIGKVVQ